MINVRDEFFLNTEILNLILRISSQKLEAVLGYEILKYIFGISS